MIELIFAVCLQVGLNHQQCKEVTLLYTDVSPLACMLGAQAELAKWVESHPNWVIAGPWKCKFVNTAEKDA